jgi:dienelactone hydrolase
MNRLEAVLGSRGRSGGQWDVWQSVYSPVAQDGYPKPIWDKSTGVIDHDVAAYWREHYDLGHILSREWAVLGPKINGKLHIYVGEADNYFLNNAVYLVESRIKELINPAPDIEVDYQPRAEHCWNGDHTQPNAYSRLRYAQMFIPRIMDQIRKRHPEGADTLSWRY